MEKVMKRAHETPDNSLQLLTQQQTKDACTANTSFPAVFGLYAIIYFS
ncbi:hypothetical protein [Mucilaginibacter terrigena]|nr:hypothetical protein [Mucilaginibacter terrigena]